VNLKSVVTHTLTTDLSLTHFMSVSYACILVIADEYKLNIFGSGYS